MIKLLKPGKYVVAVSGGVDSVALLHMLKSDSDLELIVAHFDHGIRSDSSDNAAFVAGLAQLWGFEYVPGVASLGVSASEDVARKYRYAFLREVNLRNNSKAIVVAHHQDDVIETALINVMRGTKRRGFVSLQSTDVIKRPLLAITKAEIHDYAALHGLEWFEDSTNQEMKYTRNQVRAQLYKYLTFEKRDKIVKLLDIIAEYNTQINAQVYKILLNLDDGLPKNEIASMDEIVAAEIIAAWLRNNAATFDKKTIERIVTGAKTLQNGSKIDIDKHHYCLLTKDKIVLSER